MASIKADGVKDAKAAPAVISGASAAPGGPAVGNAVAGGSASAVAAAQAAAQAAAAAAAAAAVKPLVNIVDQPLSKGTKQVSASAFAFVFSELVQYSQSRVESAADLEKRLSDAGYGIGTRLLDLLQQREKGGGRKERSAVAVLQFIYGTVWRSLFGRAADDLKKSNDKEDEYYLYERESLVNRFVSVPRDLGNLNCAAFVAGIISGILDAAMFPADVAAHYHGGSTVYVVKFAPETIKREKDAAAIALAAQS